MDRKFAAAGILSILLSASSAIAQQGDGQGHAAPNLAVLYAFASVSNLSSLTAGPVGETCSHYAPSPTSTSTTKPKPRAEHESDALAQVVNDEFTKTLRRKMPVIVAGPSYKLVKGSLVITGCFIAASPGNAAERLLGMGLGASHLAAHVRVFYIGASGPVPIDEYDLAVKGSRLLPSLGPATLVFYAATETRDTLRGDAKRLAYDILKKLKKDNSFEL